MENFFNIAYKEALKAYRKNEIPVGAIIVKNNQIIAKAHNNRQKKYNVLGHAEINCIKKATKKQKDWRLDDCYMYVTLEPCNMCKVIIKESKIKKVFYLVKQENLEEINVNICEIQTNDCVELQKIYLDLLKSFFVKLRNKVIK